MLTKRGKFLEERNVYIKTVTVGIEKIIIRKIRISGADVWYIIHLSVQNIKMLYNPPNQPSKGQECNFKFYKGREVEQK